MLTSAVADADAQVCYYRYLRFLPSGKFYYRVGSPPLITIHIQQIALPYANSIPLCLSVTTVVVPHALLCLVSEGG